MEKSTPTTITLSDTQRQLAKFKRGIDTLDQKEKESGFFAIYVNEKGRIITAGHDINVQRVVLMVVDALYGALRRAGADSEDISKLMALATAKAALDDDDE